MITSKDRLPIEVFEFPLAEIRRGYRSAIYFNRTKHILEENPEMFESATMQVFQKNQAILCGMDEVIALFRQCTGYWSDEKEAHYVFDEYMEAKIEARRNPLDFEAVNKVVYLERTLSGMWINTFDELFIEAMHDGDPIEPWQPVMKITGNLAYFAHLESVYLGILARGTKVASNTCDVVDAADGKDVLFFADRFDRWSNQAADGYAAFVGGARGVASDAMGAIWGDKGMGTMPHALIAMFHGDTAQAAKVFQATYPDTNCVALVDFNNDCVADSLKCAQMLGDKLWGVRLDTSENVVDASVAGVTDYGQFKPTGVNSALVHNVRRALDANGYRHVKIIVSGGFNPTKIEAFMDEKVPVDSFAVGSSLLQGNYDFTADIVRPCSKVGRREFDNIWLHPVKR